MNKIKERFSSANTHRVDRTRLAAAGSHRAVASRWAQLGGNAQQPVVEEVTAERIEKLYSIWDYAPKLDP